ncbi:MAG: protein translocase subunit SecD [Limnochordia bacterium]|jgi:preprotein translocase subunit SecD|nr:protein translocase subunit SecD [Limnochordia bacterium]
MHKGNRIRLALVLVLLITAGLLLYRLPLQFGLDLQGGVHVVMKAQSSDDVEVTSDLMQRVVTVIDRRINALGVTEPVIQPEGNDRVIIELPGVHDHQEALRVIGKPAQLEICDSYGNTVLTGADLKDARQSFDRFGKPAVAISFTKEGARKFAEVTAKFIGFQLPIILDGEVISSPKVESVIPDGDAIITGNFTIESAKELALQLRAGALPVPLKVMEVRNMGPSLGQESIDASLKAGIIGVILVLLYMFFYYRLPGALADVALCIYVVLVLGIMTAVRATLTLPGIAGFILSIGMAVDANVIIFERIKDEMKAGKRLRAAVDAGFDRALPAIADSNITTLIVAVVLFALGSGPIRGFAVILGIGILTSMFTAIVVTRLLISIVVDRDPDKFARYFGARGVSR